MYMWHANVNVTLAETSYGENIRQRSMCKNILEPKDKGRREGELEVSWCGNSLTRVFDCDSCGIMLTRKNKLKYHLVNLLRPETHMVVLTVRLSLSWSKVKWSYCGSFGYIGCCWCCCCSSCNISSSYCCFGCICICFQPQQAV